MEVQAENCYDFLNGVFNTLARRCAFWGPKPGVDFINQFWQLIKFECAIMTLNIWLKFAVKSNIIVHNPYSENSYVLFFDENLSQHLRIKMCMKSFRPKQRFIESVPGQRVRSSTEAFTIFSRLPNVFYVQWTNIALKIQFQQGSIVWNRSGRCYLQVHKFGVLWLFSAIESKNLA
jgi:hypothetical protein